MEVDSCRERLASYCVGNGLDLGFGGSAITKSAICIDRAESDGARAQNKLAQPTHLVGDVSDLYWFRDGVFDYVFSSHCLEDFVDVKSVLTEWMRVIKPGGFLVLFLPDEHVYCEVTPDHIRNRAHKHANFGLDFVRQVLKSMNIPETAIVHEMWPVPNNIYSFDLVVKKPSAVLAENKLNENPIAPAAADKRLFLDQTNGASYANKKLVQLGHYGDIVNILPIARDIAAQTGRPTPIICKKQYADILDGVSYAEPIVVPSDEITAEEIKDAGVVNVHASRPESPRRIPYNLQAWEQAGYLDRWKHLMPVFDLRSRIREVALVEAHITFEKPVLLYTLEGVSSSMAEKTKIAVKAAIEESFGRSFQLVDAGCVKAQRPYDLLGLIDIASVVFTVDTMLLHLCTATNVPVVAMLSNHPPVFWRASATKGNVLKAVSYDKVITNWSQIVRAVQTGSRAVCPPKSGVVHIAPIYETNDAETSRRMAAAQATWKIFHQQGALFCPQKDSTAPRLFNAGGLTLPYLKDALKLGLAQTKANNDIICFTNSDILLSPGFYAALQYRMRFNNFCCAFRTEFDLAENNAPRCYERSYGRDMFAFKRQWLADNFDAIPDFLLGVGGWDYALAMWFRILSGRKPESCDPAACMADIEMGYGFISHERHSARWYANADNSYDEAYEHNRACLETFLTRIGLERAHKDIK